APAMLFGQPATGSIDLKSARTVVQQAETLAASGNTPQAIGAVNKLVQSKQPKEPAAEGLLYFTLGWLSHNLAMTQPNDRKELLTQSAGYYQRVLRSFPSHTEAIENLAQVLRELGRPTQAITLIRKLQPTNEAPARTYARLLTLGDLYL